MAPTISSSTSMPTASRSSPGTCPGRSMNVIDLAVIEELSAIVEKVAADAAIKGAVITSGKDTFCAGADLTLLESLSAHVRRHGQGARARRPRRRTLFDESRKLSQLYRRIETCGKPFVAAINGTALGGGFELVPRLPPAHRRRQRQDPPRPARGQDRPVPRRRRHPAHRAHDAAGRRAAIPAQGRPAQPRPAPRR